MGYVIVNPYVFGGGPPPSGLYALILAQNPVAYWRHDEASGTVMVDASPNARNGSYTGATIPYPPIYVGGGTCMGSTTSSQYGEYSPALPALNAMTIVTIYKPFATSGFQILPTRDQGGTRMFQWRTNGTAMEFVKIVGGVSTSSSASGVFAGGVSSMVAITISATGTLTMYQNGVQIGSPFSIAAANYGGAADPFVIGYSPGAGASANGYNSETALFDVDLPAATLLSFATAAGF